MDRKEKRKKKETKKVREISNQGFRNELIKFGLGNPF